MAVTTFIVTDVDGNALTGLSPVFLSAFDANTLGSITPPSIYEVDDGVYAFDAGDVDVTGMIDTVSGLSSPRYMFTLPTRGNAFAVYTSEGLPDSGQSPIFGVYQEAITGDNITPKPTIVNLGDGVYGFDPGTPETEAIGEVYTGGFPESTSVFVPLFAADATPNNLGLKLLDEPGVFEILYKSYREKDWDTAGVLPLEAGVDEVPDDSGNGWGLLNPADIDVTNGPLGKAGWDKANPSNLQFARRFYGDQSGDMRTSLFTSSVVSGACQAEHTVQLLVKVEWDDFTTDRGIHATILNDTAAGTANDLVNRISVVQNGTGSGGRFAHFTEDTDTGSTVYTTDNSVRPGLWQLITFAHDIKDASLFTTRIYVHTLETNGSVTGGLNSTVDTQRCNVLSGVSTGRIGYGKYELSSGGRFIGDIGLGRLVKESLSDTDCNNQATSLLQNGKLDDYGSNELYRHEFNSRPDLVDEGPLGVHLWGNGDAPANYDTVGTGGRPWRCGPSPRYLCRMTPAPVSLQGILSAGQAVKINDLFNSDLQAVPSWTWQAFMAPGDLASFSPIDFSDVAGETEAENTFQVTLDSASGVVATSEYGAGTDAVQDAVTGSVPLSFKDRAGTHLYTVRYGDNPGDPGDPRIRVSYDGSADVASTGLDENFTGGDDHTGLRNDFQGAAIQELYFCTRELTDQEVLDRYENRLFLYDTTTYVMRGYDDNLSKLVYWSSNRLDSNGLDYTGPGNLSDIVVQRILS